MSRPQNKVTALQDVKRRRELQRNTRLQRVRRRQQQRQEREFIEDNDEDTDEDTNEDSDDELENWTRLGELMIKLLGDCYDLLITKLTDIVTSIVASIVEVKFNDRIQKIVDDKFKVFEDRLNKQQ